MCSKVMWYILEDLSTYKLKGKISSRPLGSPLGGQGSPSSKVPFLFAQNFDKNSIDFVTVHHKLKCEQEEKIFMADCINWTIKPYTLT